MSEDDEKKDPVQRMSERAFRLEQNIREIQESTTVTVDERTRRIDEILKGYLEDVAATSVNPLEEDTKIRNLKSIADKAGITVEQLLKPKAPRPAQVLEPITRPPLTKPTPEALRDSRREDTPAPPPRETLPSSGSIQPITPRDIVMKPIVVRQSLPDVTERILIIDDDPGILKVLAEILSEEGFHVYVALGPWQAAVELATHERVDIILLDWMMPYVNGAEFVDWLNKPHNPWFAIPVIVITAGPVPPKDDRFISKKKPINYEDLLATIRRRIDEYRAFARR
jgi:CheY-like chemotaxis protein